MNVEDIVGVARLSPLRWCIYEAGWRAATARFQPVPKPLPEGQDRLGLTNTSRQYSISLTNMDQTGRRCEPSQPSAVSRWRGVGIEARAEARAEPPSPRGTPLRGLGDTAVPRTAHREV